MLSLNTNVTISANGLLPPIPSSRKEKRKSSVPQTSEHKEKRARFSPEQPSDSASLAVLKTSFLSIPSFSSVSSFASSSSSSSSSLTSSASQLRTDGLVDLLSNSFDQKQVAAIGKAAQELFDAGNAKYQKIEQPFKADLFCDGKEVRTYIALCKCKKSKCKCDAPAGGTKTCLPALRILLSPTKHPEVDRAAKLVVYERTERNMRELQTEVQFLRLFAGNTDRIAQLFDYQLDEGLLYQKFYNRGTLFEFFEKNAVLTYEKNYEIFHGLFLDILEGLYDLEKQKLVHLDFTELNIMLHEENKGRLRAIIIDLQRADYVNARYSSDDPSIFTSPLCLKSDLDLAEYRLNKMNIWTAGCIFHWMIFGTHLRSTHLVEKVGWFNRLRLNSIEKEYRKPSNKKPSQTDIEEAIDFIKLGIGNVNEIPIQTLLYWGKEDPKIDGPFKEKLEQLDDLFDCLNGMKASIICAVEKELKALIDAVRDKLNKTWAACDSQKIKDPIHQLIWCHMLNPNCIYRKSAEDLIPMLKELIEESAATAGKDELKAS